MSKTLFLWTIKDIIEVIIGCINNKFDIIIFIDGNRGLGKSTLMYKIASRLDKIPIPFNPQRDIVYTREDTIKHLATKKGGVICSDELINVAYNRDFYEQQQKILLKALNFYRDSCNVFIGCIPRFRELDTQIQRLCKIRITIIKRGLAVVQTKVQSIYVNDVWDIRGNEKIESKWASKGMRNPRYVQLSTCRGILRFNDITPMQREEYERIKEEKRNRVFGKFQDDTLLGNPELKFYNTLIENLKAGKLNPESFEVLAKINNITPSRMRFRVNEILKEAGDSKRWRDYCMTTDKKARRDKLGFAITPKPSTALIGQDAPAPPTQQQEEEGDWTDEDTEPEDKAEEEDIFDFGKQGGSGKDGTTTAQQ